MPRWPLVSLSCALVVALGAAAYLAKAPRPMPPVPASQDEDYDAGPVGDFRLTERSGRVVTPADLRGKVWVASFVFTCCTTQCPQISGTMARLQQELAGEPDVRL